MINRIVLLFTSVIALSSSGAMGDGSDTISKLQEIHKDLESVRDQSYGNCFLQGTTLETFQGASEDVDASDKHEYFKFWSREGKYFRIDTFADDKFERMLQRVILRPEGFVVLRRGGNGLAIVEKGNVKKGLSKLFRYRFFQGSTRATLLFAESSFAWFAGIAKYEIPLPPQTKQEVVVDSKPDQLMVTSSFVNSETGGSSVVKSYFSTERPYVLTKHETTSSKPNELPRTTQVKLEFGSKSKTISSRIELIEKDPEGVTSNQTTKLDTIDPTAQAMSLFDVPSMTKEFKPRIWIYLVVLMLVLSAIAIAALIRRGSFTT